MTPLFHFPELIGWYPETLGIIQAVLIKITSINSVPCASSILRTLITITAFNPLYNQVFRLTNLRYRDANVSGVSQLLSW